MPTGVVLSGGRSTRFGEADKAVADLAGTPMIRRVAERLRGPVDSLVVNCRADQRAAIEAAMEGYGLPVTYALDETPDEGPMAGIAAGLRAASDEYAVVVACDMPFVDPEFVAYLFDRVEGHDAAVPRLDDEWFQTTQAAYRADSMAAACERALERGDRKIIDPLFTLDYVVLDDEEVRAHAAENTFQNVNTQDELRAAVRAIRDENQ